MGCCYSILIEDDAEPGYGALQVYRRQQRRWTTPVPVTRSQLEKERQDFWETIALYEGRPEVWQTIRSALEERDRNQIQAILDAARLVVPSDRTVEMTMTHVAGFDSRDYFTCFDHLGNRYVVPLMFISAPSNLVEDSPLTPSNAALGVGVAAPAVDSREDSSARCQAADNTDAGGVGTPGVSSDSSGSSDGESNSRATLGKQKQKHHSKEEDDRSLQSLEQGNASQMARGEAGGAFTADQESTSTAINNPIIIRVRLSTAQKEHQLSIAAPVVTVASVKRALVKHLEATSKDADIHRIRIFFLGRVLADEEQLTNVSHFEMGASGTMLQAHIIP